jgi:hypothetical protein
MGRVYAGILGPLACATFIARSLLRGGEVGQAVGMASLVLFSFAALGYIIGSVAERTIVEAIGNEFQVHWATRDSAASQSHSADASSGVSDAPA